eukprot:SAG31_NODE_13297_length_878_cov_1.840822_1_plen_169_part_01
MLRGVPPEERLPRDQPVSRGQFKTSLCVFFEKGRCDRGASCTFAHGRAELRTAQREGITRYEGGFFAGRTEEARWETLRDGVARPRRNEPSTKSLMEAEAQPRPALTPQPAPQCGTVMEGLFKQGGRWKRCTVVSSVPVNVKGVSHVLVQFDGYDDHVPLAMDRLRPNA